jgi:predicted nucleotidyltransferase
VRLILAFGSRVNGWLHSNSDLDLAVLHNGESKPLEVAADLQDVFPEYEVDVVNLNRANPLLLKSVIKGCQLLAGEKSHYYEFRIHAFHRYQDFKPYLKLEGKLNARRLERLINGR